MCVRGQQRSSVRGYVCVRGQQLSSVQGKEGVRGQQLPSDMVLACVLSVKWSRGDNILVSKVAQF